MSHVRDDVPTQLKRFGQVICGPVTAVSTRLHGDARREIAKWLETGEIDEERLEP